MVAFKDIDQFDDKATWDLICDGNTKGVFQLESKLGSSWAKRTKPRNIEELSDLIAIIRPGMLDAVVDGKSMTKHYVDRKHGKEPITYVHECLEPILRQTQGTVTYQEQAIRIAIDVAGFSPEEGDALRKACGKKSADLMREVKEKFISGCVSKGIVNEEIAHKIFEQIEASSRYSFNKCLMDTTNVETPHGFKKIRDLKVGERVLDPDGNFVRVVRKYDNGEKEVYGITLDKGGYIECTLDHKFQCVGYLGKKWVLPLYLIILEGYKIVLKHGLSASVYSINQLGIRETVDIEVDNESHLFWGNGIATSNSHSVAYAINSFRSAYCKAHDPLSFYCTYLNHAHNKPDKQEEIRELISDAKRNGIEVYPPTLDNFYRCFKKDSAKNIIYFGYSNVKNVGEGEQEKIETHVNSVQEQLNKNISEFNWMELLLYFSPKVKKTAFVSLISVGAFNGKNNQKSRNAMLFEYKTFLDLTDKEVNWIVNEYPSKKYETLVDAIKDSINSNSKINSRRVKTVQDLYSSLKNPPHSLDDSIEWKAEVENKLMGCSLSCVQTDAVSAEEADCTCRDLTSRNTRPGHATVVVQIKRCGEYIIKKGEKAGEIMAFLTVEDFTGECDSFVVFSDVYSKIKKLLFAGNTVVLTGVVKERDKDLSFIVNEAKQI